ncbi:hypothetical protein ACGFX2_25885 [Streptomyces goshikiensis]|uniref:hypothetical protein n=1 Tax=Streptomyces goshikiensis TaxID=1942 RepID=UPI00371CB781
MGPRTHRHPHSLGEEIADALQPVGPSRGQWNYYFHTKLKPAFADVRDKATGEIRYHRVDPDASLTVEGGDQIVYGNKFLSAAIRLANIPHSRVILGIESLRTKSAELDPERDDEGTAFVKLAQSILRRAPRLRAITYETGLRGVHRAPLIAEGLVVFTTQHGGLTPERSNATKTVPTATTYTWPRVGPASVSSPSKAPRTTSRSPS